MERRNREDQPMTPGERAIKVYQAWLARDKLRRKLEPFINPPPGPDPVKFWVRWMDSQVLNDQPQRSNMITMACTQFQESIGSIQRVLTTRRQVCQCRHCDYSERCTRGITLALLVAGVAGVAVGVIIMAHW